MIERFALLQELSASVRNTPVTALLGPRQCGKTTLAKEFADARNGSYFDLESQEDQARLENPATILRQLAASKDSLVVLDEIQQVPQLFNVLRVVVDDPQVQGRFLVLGSASPTIIKGVSESLAGRIHFIELGGFSLEEAGQQSMHTLLVRGGFPRSFLAATDAASRTWREDFIQTFLQRDIHQFGFATPAPALRRLWTMLAHYHAQTCNYSEIARSMDITTKTVRAWLDILTGTYMVRQLQPWFVNISKRQVKAPKVYIRDTGILHSLLGIEDYHALLGHPRLGASWEGFAIEQVLRILQPPEAYFWATHSGAELDLLLMRRGKNHGFEMKFAEAPKISRSMEVARADLQLEHLWVIYPGQHRFPMNSRTTALPLSHLPALRNEI